MIQISKKNRSLRILDTKYSKSRRGFSLDREIKKARKKSQDQLSLLEIEPFKWWEDRAHKKQVKECFEEYLRDIEDKLILMRSKEKKAPLVKDYEVRFSKKRLRKARWQLGGIKIECGTHLVLTVDPSRYRNVVECVKGLRKEWNDIRRWIERRKTVKRLSYIEVLEFCKEHDLPHLHVLLGRVFFAKEDLKALYGHRGEQRIRLTRIRDYDALGYVLKYASKVYNDFETVRESQAYLYWVTDAKVYGMSRDHYESIHSREVAMVAFGWFMRMHDGEEYEGYEFVGIFDSGCWIPLPPLLRMIG